MAAAADDVWAMVGDFGAVGDFLPGIDSLQLEGDDRVISMFGMVIRERLVDRDDGARSITYAIVDGVPVEAHRATITVEPRGDALAWSRGGSRSSPTRWPRSSPTPTARASAALERHFA